MNCSRVFAVICVVGLSTGMAAAAEKGIGIIVDGSPYSTLPSSVTNQVPGYQLDSFSTYQVAPGFIYGDPMGKHLIVEGVFYSLSFKASDRSSSSKFDGTTVSGQNVRVMGARAGYHFNFISRPNKFSVGFDVLGGVGQLSGSVIGKVPGVGLETASLANSWKSVTGYNIFPLIHAGPTVTFPVANTGIFVTVGAAIDVPSGIAMTSRITFSPSSWRH